jgi:hypothetical protein
LILRKQTFERDEVVAFDDEIFIRILALEREFRIILDV